MNDPLPHLGRLLHHRSSPAFHSRMTVCFPRLCGTSSELPRYTDTPTPTPFSMAQDTKKLHRKAGWGASKLRGQRTGAVQEDSSRTYCCMGPDCDALAPLRLVSDVLGAQVPPRLQAWLWGQVQVSLVQLSVLPPGFPWHFLPPDFFTKKPPQSVGEHGPEGHDNTPGGDCHQ